MKDFHRRPRFSFAVWMLIACLPFASAENKSKEDEPNQMLVMGLIQSLHKNAASAQQAAQSLAKLGPSAQAAVDDLVDTFHYDEEPVAAAVSDALFSIGAPSLKPLERALGDSSFIVRRRAAETLGRFGSGAKHAAPALVELLADSQMGVHSAAEKALMQMGDDAIPALAAELKRGNEEVRKLVLLTLSRCGPKAVPLVLERLKKDENAYIRANAAEALGQTHPTPEVIQALTQALSDLEEGVRSAAVDVLGQFGDASKPAIGPLIVIAEQDQDSLTRKKAADALGQIGPATTESLGGLIAGLRSSKEEVRRRIIDTFGKSTIAWPDQLPILESALQDPDALVREKVIEVAAKAGSPALPLLKTALHDASPTVRSAAITALGQMKDSGDVAAAELGRLLADPDAVVRRQVIQAMGNLGMPGLPGLIQALSDSYSVLSDDAGKAIVRLGHDAIPALESLKNSSDPVMKQKADTLLKRIQKKSHSVPH